MCTMNEWIRIRHGVYTFLHQCEIVHYWFFPYSLGACYFALSIGHSPTWISESYFFLNFGHLAFGIPDHGLSQTMAVKEARSLLGRGFTRDLPELPLIVPIDDGKYSFLHINHFLKNINIPISSFLTAFNFPPPTPFVHIVSNLSKTNTF